MEDVIYHDGAEVLDNVGTHSVRALQYGDQLQVELKLHGDTCTLIGKGRQTGSGHHCSKLTEDVDRWLTIPLAVATEG